MAHVAGHDINYIGLSGALFYSGEAGRPPFSPPTLVGDIGGGALYLAVGILAAVLAARSDGKGRVVDAAIVDGSAHMMNLLLSLNADNPRAFERGQTLLDGPHWYRAYRCADSEYVTIGPVEPKFYSLLMEKLGLADDPAFAAQYDPVVWPTLGARLERLFATRTAAEWRVLLEGTDICFAPVLTPTQSAEHPHMAAREIYSRAHGVLQARAAPRFVGEEVPDPPSVPRNGEHSSEILREIGMAPLETINNN
nr:CaiB/BaiF CoA-transferase family protein [Sphingobium sp. 15-1]